MAPWKILNLCFPKNIPIQPDVRRKDVAWKMLRVSYIPSFVGNGTETSLDGK